jgi:hypothetical protein
VLVIGDDEGNGLNAKRVCRLRVDGMITFRDDNVFVAACCVQEALVLSRYANDLCVEQRCDSGAHLFQFHLQNATHLGRYDVVGVTRRRRDRSGYHVTMINYISVSVCLQYLGVLIIVGAIFASAHSTTEAVRSGRCVPLIYSFVGSGAYLGTCIFTLAGTSPGVP